jgi:EAL domain-containing protein (putative c-di-GMP-specific phosphodiesterase class I)
MGQGLFLKVAQVVAEEFGISIERVKITSTRTDKVPNTAPTAASAGSDLNGMAARNAARVIKERLTAFASELYGVDPARVSVEVTESVLIREPGQAIAALAHLRGAGVRVAIDDFGAGHTSLRHLREFPIDILKLDGAFTQNLARSTDDRFFVRTLLDLAQHLNVETVAEWVDTEAAARMLAEWGVTYLQGHLTGAAEIWTPGSSSQARAA